MSGPGATAGSTAGSGLVAEVVGPVAEVVVGATDIAVVVGFLGLFGLVQIDSVEIGDDEAQHLFGVPAIADRAVRLAAPAAPGRATVLVVPTLIPGRPTVDWELGPRALDIYTTDLDRGIAAAAGAGWTVSPEAVLAGGPMRMRQQMVTGPDGLAVVLVDSTHRRSSVCDMADPPLHSEPHSVVWSVADHAAERERWRVAGWTAGATIGFSEPSVSDELGLPESPTPITMTMLSDAEVAPIRLELMTFDDHQPDQPGRPGRPDQHEPGELPDQPDQPGRPGRPDQPEPGELPSPDATIGGRRPGAAIAGGLHALVVDVGAVAAAIDAWGDGATFGTATTDAGGRSLVAGVSRGGVRFVLRSVG